MSLKEDFIKVAGDPDRVLGEAGETVLHLAARDGDIDTASFALVKHASVNATDKANNTPVIYAAERGDIILLRLLLADNNKGINHAGDLGTALGVAATAGELEVAATLLEFGADINAKDKTGTTALMTAITAKQPRMVDYLLKKNADALARRDDNECVLHIAARAGMPEILESLFAYGAARSLQVQTTKEGQTPLHTAVLAGKPAAVEALLDHGAFTHIPNTEKMTPLDIAAFKGDAAMARQLVQYGHADVAKTPAGEDSALHRALFEKNLDAARELVRLGADPYAADKQGRTPLHIAAWKGELDMVRFFIEEIPPQENIAAAAQSRADALYEAIFYSHSDIADYLINTAGVDLNVPNSTGNYALTAAMDKYNTQRIATMLEKGASPDVKDKNGNTPLLVSARKGTVDAATLLLKHKADTEIADGGETPIFAAVEAGHASMVELLAGAGANIFATNATGMTPIDVARMKSKADIVPILESAAADYGYRKNTQKFEPFNPS
ncbi:MAG: ankyrin repeat domain-containing protein [Micavibrio sp.]|nr:ankyrin repeat domain-containing protein [Micavibrio sp.]